MLTLRSQTPQLRETMSRRDVLRLSLGTALASAVPWAALNTFTNAATPDEQTKFGQAKACIYIYLYGGPSHLDIWDMKPEAPAEVRGEFKPISTKVPGLQLCEHLPKLAQRADKLAIVRSLTHAGGGHGSSAHQMLTGQPSSKQGEVPPTPQDHPHIGSVAARMANKPNMPVAVSLPWEIKTQVNVIPGQAAGFLGDKYDPVRIQYEDQLGSKFLLPDPGKLATAIALEKESDATRDRYGRNIFGQSLLMAKRLVESGVRVVTVYWPDRKDEKALHFNGVRNPVSVPMWDTHGSHVGDTANFPSLKNRLLPPMDLASSALLDDLSASGRLDETLLIWAGEFGRSPRLQGDGRGHFTRCFSSMLAGGGIQGGTVYGESDATGSAPSRDPVSPADFIATAYHLLGVPSDTELAGAEGPARKIITGSAVSGLIG